MSRGHCDKLPPVGGLKHIGSATILDARRLKSGANSFFASSGCWWLSPFRGLWLHHSPRCLCDHVTSSSVHFRSPSTPFSYKDTCH